MRTWLHFLLLFIFCILSFSLGWFLSLKYQEQLYKARKENVRLNLKLKKLNLKSVQKAPTFKDVVKPLLKQEVSKITQPAPVAQKKDVSTSQKATDKQKLYNKKNWQAFSQVKNRQKYFFFNGKYSFLINVFSQEEQALDYLKTSRQAHPEWSFFIVEDKNKFRIYLGPFRTKEQASSFMNQITDPKPFPNYFLEKRGLTE